jgi:hypothetical protein
VCDLVRVYSSSKWENAATWHAIVARIEALSTGLIKLIGDGASVFIWTDKWILGLRTMMLLEHIEVDIEKDA